MDLDSQAPDAPQPVKGLQLQDLGSQPLDVNPQTTVALQTAKEQQLGDKESQPRDLDSPAPDAAQLGERKHQQEDCGLQELADDSAMLSSETQSTTLLLQSDTQVSDTQEEVDSQQDTQPFELQIEKQDTESQSGNQSRMQAADLQEDTQPFDL